MDHGQLRRHHRVRIERRGRQQGRPFPFASDGAKGTWSRADLHVHTSHSPHHGGVLAALRLAESFTSPSDALRQALARGMDFVAITDHDTITGALELAGDPRVIVGCEISARFPHDATMIHVIALGLDETTHRVAQELRGNIFELVEFLALEGIFHFVAHPFYRMGNLSLAHFEQLLLLFKAFETRNGGKQLSPPWVLDRTLDSLTPDLLMELANKYDIAPFGPEPWIKTRVGGSDDHGGIAIGTTFTVTPPAADASTFLRHLQLGLARAGGAEGSVASIAAQYLGYGAALLDARVRRCGARSARASDLLCRLSVPRAPRGRPKVVVGLAKGLFETVRAAVDPSSPLKREVTRTILRDPSLRRLLLAGVPPRPDPLHALLPTLRRLSQGVASRLRRCPDPLYASLASFMPAMPLLPMIAALVAEFRQRPLMRTIHRRYLWRGAVQRGLVCVDLDSARALACPSPRTFLAPELRHHTHLTVLSPDTLPGSEAVRAIRENEASRLLGALLRVAECDFDRIYCLTTGPVGLCGIVLGALLDIPVTVCFGRRERRLARRVLLDGPRHGPWARVIELVLAGVDEVRVDSEASELAARLAGATSAQIRTMPRLSSRAPWRQGDIREREATR